MTRRVAWPALLFAAQAAAGGAAAQGRVDSVGDDVKHLVDDVLYIWRAPVRLSMEDLPLLIAAAEVVVAAGVYDDEVHAWLRAHPRSGAVALLAPAREGGPLFPIGLTPMLLPLSTGLYLAGRAGGSEPLRRAGLGCATADIANTLARHTLARLVGRLRPRYTDDPYRIRPLAFGPWPVRSFPNGHGANIMACAAFWANAFELGPAEPALYLLAAVVGLARVADEAHWLSDTVAGAAFGYAVGAAVADRPRERAEARAAPAGAARAPHPAPRVSLVWRLPL